MHEKNLSTLGQWKFIYDDARNENIFLKTSEPSLWLGSEL